LINREVDGGIRYLDLMIQPVGDGSGSATVWIIDVTRLAEPCVRAATAMGDAGTLHMMALRDQVVSMHAATRPEPSRT